MTSELISPAPSKDALSWAHAQLQEAMSGRKERFKLLAANAAVLREALLAVLLVARRKHAAYHAAISGKQNDSFGWINRDPELAAAVSLVSRHLISCDDIAQLPPALLVYVHEVKEEVSVQGDFFGAIA